jgi:hypothetical protein
VENANELQFACSCTLHSRSSSSFSPSGLFDGLAIGFPRPTSAQIPRQRSNACEINPGSNRKNQLSPQSHCIQRIPVIREGLSSKAGKTKKQNEKEGKTNQFLLFSLSLSLSRFLLSTAAAAAAAASLLI